MKKGKGKGFAAAALLASGVAIFAVSSGASAALVTISKVLTNNTATTQSYQFSEMLTITEAISQIGAIGSVSMVVTDFNRNGATVASDSGNFYSGWINGAKVQSFMPGPGPTSYSLTAAARGQASMSTGFGSPDPVALGQGLAVNDTIEVRFNFTLSAGDQVAFTGTFDLVNYSAVPAPSAAALILLSPLFGGRHRRRTENGH